MKTFSLIYLFFYESTPVGLHKTQVFERTTGLNTLCHIGGKETKFITPCRNNLIYSVSFSPYMAVDAPLCLSSLSAASQRL